MKRVTNNAGSVLLLVMGLLTVIALVGTAFVLISTMDRKTSTAMATLQPMDTIAREYLGIIVNDRFQDLCISDTPSASTGITGPYAEANAPWKSIDYPSEGCDKILASTVPEPNVLTFLTTDPNISKLAWRHLSNPYHCTDPNAFTSVWIGAQFAGLNNTYPMASACGFNYLDTDGNTYDHDAILWDTGNKDAYGRDYYVAVRVIDASSLVNINAANGVQMTATDPNLWNAMGINLQQVLMLPGGQATDALTMANWLRYNSDPNLGRSKSGNANAYYSTYVSHPWLNSDTINNRPYADSEMLVIQNGDANATNPTDSNYFVGRLGLTFRTNYRVNFETQRRYLTTNSANRAIARVYRDYANSLGNNTNSWTAPYGVQYTADQYFRLDLNSGTPGDPTTFKKLASAIRNAMDPNVSTFYQVAGANPMYTSATPDPNISKMIVACQMAANILAFRATDATVVTVYPTGAYSGTVSSIPIAGMTRQPFVTKAFCKRVRVDPNVPSSLAEYSILELMNPYDTPFPLNNVSLVDGGGATLTMSVTAGSAIPGNGGKQVFYNAYCPDGNYTGKIAVGDMAVDPNAHPLTVTGLKLATVGAKILRSTGDSNLPNICLQNLVQVDPGIVSNASKPDANTYWTCTCWDDRSVYGRYTLNSTAKQHKGWTLSTVATAADANGPDYTTKYPTRTVDGNYSIPGSGKGNNTINPSWYGADANVAAYCCPIYIRNGQFLNVGELAKIYYVGPDANTDIRTKLENLRTMSDPNGVMFPGDPHFSLGRFDPATGYCDPATTTDPNSFRRGRPFLTVGAALPDYLMVNSPLNNYTANLDSNWKGVIFGQININTAPAVVLRTLPGLSRLYTCGINAAPGIDSADGNVIINTILNYRDLLDPNDVRLKDPYSKLIRMDPNMFPFIDGDDYHGFASIGEIAIPLRRAITGVSTAALLGDPNNKLPLASNVTPLYNTTGDANYITPLKSYVAYTSGYEDGLSQISDANLLDACKRNGFYNAMCNQITVRSDVYIAFIRVQVTNNVTNPEAMRRYVAIIDRSQVRTTTDRPKVLIFAPVRRD